MKKNLRKSNKMSVISINKKYKIGTSHSAEFLKMELALVDESKIIMQGIFDNVFSLWKLYELGEFETLTEYNGFLTEV